MDGGRIVLNNRLSSERPSGRPVYRAIFERRDCRQFLPDPLPDA